MTTAQRRPECWTAAEVPDQTGRVAVVTGGNTGIGFHTARVLAQRGATVVLACRDIARAQHAAGRMADPSGPGRPAVDVLPLDLSSLASIRDAAAQLQARYDRIDVLINNAGVMDTPHRTTQDGFELQLGVNHLGHFALTGLLLPQLLKAAGSRIVTVSSISHRDGTINFTDLQSEHRYRRSAAYAQSKLANLMFSYELQRRLAAAGGQTVALAAHPGIARTELTRNLAAPVRLAYLPVIRWVAQSSSDGALPSLRAATDPQARGGDYFGPDGRNEYKGYPVRVASSDASHKADAQRRLWEESERLTGVSYPA
ncbi:MAG: oxidoreductase [Streptosporangiaceae bacterium]